MSTGSPHYTIVHYTIHHTKERIVIVFPRLHLSHTHPVSPSMSSVVIEVDLKLRWVRGLERCEVLSHELVVGGRGHGGGVVDVLAADVEPVPSVAAHAVSHMCIIAVSET